MAEKSLIELQAEAYQILVQINNWQRRLQEVEQQIVAKTAQEGRKDG